MPRGRVKKAQAGPTIDRPYKTPDELKAKMQEYFHSCEAEVFPDEAGMRIFLDLDHENDFELMEVIANHLFSTREDFKRIYDHVPL